MIVLAQSPGEEPTATLVRLDATAGASIVFSASVPHGRAAVAALDGGMHVIDEQGTLRSLDPTGQTTGEIETGLTGVSNAALDDVTGRVAVASGQSGAVIVDPATGEVQVVPITSGVTTVGFVRGGDVLALTTGDGNVRIWDVGSESTPTLVWDGSGSRAVGAPWYDPATDSMWVSSSGKILNFPLDPQQWIERACTIVGRDLTQEEWDRFVPGDEPLQSACAK